MDDFQFIFDQWSQIVLLTLGGVFFSQPLEVGKLASQNMDSITWLTEAFIRYGYWIVFFGVMLENAGIPLPGETVLLAAAFFAYQGHFHLGAVISIAFLGAVLGDNAGYWIGRRGGRPLLERYGRYFFLSPERLSGLDDFFARHGRKAIFFARFVTAMRVFAALFAGACRMPWPRFFIYNVAGAIVWSVAIGLLGYLFGYSWETLAHWLKRGSLIVSAALLLIVLIFWSRRRLAEWQRALDAWLPRALGLRELAIICVTLLSLGLFSLIAEAITASKSKSFDQAVLQIIHESVPQNWEPRMNVVTALGSYAFLGGLVIVILWVLAWRRRWESLRLIVVAGLATPLLNEGLKLVFHRTRPELWTKLSDSPSYSFPSGHALGSVVIYGVLAYLLGQALPRWRTAFWGLYMALVALVGFSRLYLGHHWPTDVLGGWAAGALLLFGLIYWHKRYDHLPVLLWNKLSKRIAASRNSKRA